MATSHYCEPAGDWVEGPLTACEHHKKIDTGTARPLREGPITRAKNDRRAGQVGTDRGGFISGEDYGR